MSSGALIRGAQPREELKDVDESFDIGGEPPLQVGDLLLPFDGAVAVEEEYVRRARVRHRAGRRHAGDRVCSEGRHRIRTDG